MIVVRLAGTLSLAPIFGAKNVPRRVRVFLAIAIGMLVFQKIGYTPLEYTTTIGFTVILIKELIVGLSIGFSASVVMAVITMAGEFIDREMGFTMVSNFDPFTNSNTTITAEFYNYLVMLIMICSNMHYYIIAAVADSFQVIPVGGAIFNGDAVYEILLRLIGNYFVIAFRISLPVFVSVMLLNVILGILARSAPQMNMFAIGIQLKIIVGLMVLVITIMFLPNITNYIYSEMCDVINTVIKGMY